MVAQGEADQPVHRACPNGALTQVNSLASAAIPNLPPGTLPPVILPFDPTSSTPVCIVAVNSTTQDEAILYDTGRYEVRNMIMAEPGAVAPVVYGGKIRAVLAYLDREKMQARNLSPLDVLNAILRSNVFISGGDAKFGRFDYMLDSNAMYLQPEAMGDIPVKSKEGRTIFLRDVATPMDTSMIQTNIVRLATPTQPGRREVYIPVYRQMGSSTLTVVDAVKQAVPDMMAKLTHPDIELKVVMDQSVYVRSSIESLAEEGILGAVLCSLVILVFLGEWRMTVIAVMTIPVSVLAAVIFLNATGNTINVMTLAGLSLAIGPLVDSAIICLENTHRHLGLGSRPKEAAFLGASEVAMPELVASCCTLLVLAPLAFMPGLGTFLFRPMAMAVAFAMIAAYVLSRSFVPALCSLWMKPHAAHPQDNNHDEDYQHRSAHEHGANRRGLGRLFARWEAALDSAIRLYVRALNVVMRRRLLMVLGAVGLLAVVLVGLGLQLRREFFPEVDAGAFEIFARAPTGTKIEDTEKHIAQVENYIRAKLKDDLKLIISELGVVPDWSAAYTPNAGPMDAVLRVQLTEDRSRSAQEYVHLLRLGFRADPRFRDLEFAFDAGGMIRGAMNEGKATPINVRIAGKNLKKAHAVAVAMQRAVRKIPGVVDSRIMQRLNYPQYFIEVDRAKAADLGLTTAEIMQNVVSALNSSIQFNKRNFWIDPVSHNQYYVGVQYPEKDIEDIETLMNVPITSKVQRKSIPLRNVATYHRMSVPAEITHTDLQPTIDLTMSVYGRDLGHVADDVYAAVERFGKPKGRARWQPYDPTVPGKKLMTGSTIILTGEYTRMQDTFRNLGTGLALASILIYFLMVALFKSWLSPLVILFAVPIGLTGVILMLFLTGTAINVQSLLGMIFMVGIVVSNTVLLVDFAQNLRHEEKLSPTAAIVKAASIRVRPVVMTALAAFFALIPMALALARGSEANAPLGRAVIGGLLAGLVTTLFVVPCLFSLLIKDRPQADEEEPERPTPLPPSEAIRPDIGGGT